MVIQVENLTKRFDRFTAIDHISFGVAESEIMGLLGPNGAGKTTTIHMLLGLITPTEGKISIFSKELAAYREAILQQVNFTSPYVALPYRLTVLENLMIFARLYGLQRPRERISELLELFGIEDLKNKTAALLSAGENTKVGVVKALLNQPKLLLLDEPTASLDPEAAHRVREVLLELRKTTKMTILYTSHYMMEIEKMCDRIIFLNHGRIVSVGTPVEVTRAILREERKEPALEEAFFRVVKESSSPSDEKI